MHADAVILLYVRTAGKKRFARMAKWQIWTCPAIYLENGTRAIQILPQYTATHGAVRPRVAAPLRTVRNGSILSFQAP